MEEALEATRSGLDALAPALEAWREAETSFSELAGYYGSQRWHADRDADARGAFGPGIRRGVLGEDLAYDALVEARALAVSMMEAATLIVRNV